MPLELRPDSQYWYGRYKVHGRRVCVSLEIPVDGKRPASLRKQGDAKFEASRLAAKNKLDALTEESHSHRDATYLVERLYEIKTGETIQSPTLKELPAAWLKVPRRRPLNPRYALQCNATLTRFAKFVRGKNAKVMELAGVTRQLAADFMTAEEERGITSKTWNDVLKLMRAVCKYLLPPGSINPFGRIPTREVETVFRKPFTPEELQRITDAAREDDFTRPILITGICTAMRRGDCCLLRWKDVDLKKRFITVKTNKTGQTVTIPIFPLLYDELAARKQTGDYVFPEQATMYRENPDGITWRVQKILTTAFTTKADGKALPKLSEKETRRKVHEYLAQLPTTDKTARMRRVFDLYMDQKRPKEIMQAAGVSKGSVFGYLNAIEAATGSRVLRGEKDQRSTTARVRTDKTILHAERAGGTRRASTRDFHSFRVTWVTIALTAGVPLELVQKVTGHRTADIVLKHYFQPGREDFRRTIQAAMPKMLVSTQKPYATNASAGECLHMALTELEAMTTRDWKEKRDLIANLVHRAKDWHDGHILREAVTAKTE